MKLRRPVAIGWVAALAALGAVSFWHPEHSAAQSGATCLDYGQRAETHATSETSYSLSATDQCALLVFQNTSGEVVTAPNPGALFFKGWTVKIFELGAGGLTLQVPSGSATTINNGANIVLSQHYGAQLYIDKGLNWWALTSTGF